MVKRYIDILTMIINFPYILHMYYMFFWQLHPYFFVHFLNVFFCLVSVIFLTIYSKRHSKNVRDRSKNRDPANIIGEQSEPHTYRTAEKNLRHI